MREWVECIVVDGVTLRPICGQMDELHDVVRCVERGDLHEELEELVRDRTWGLRIDVEWLGGPSQPRPQKLKSRSMASRRTLDVSRGGLFQSPTRSYHQQATSFSPC